MEGIFITRTSRGRFAESWVISDALGLMQQLGVGTGFGKAKAEAN